jgi:hypothetical protein
MARFRTSSADIVDQLLPLMTDRSFHDLDIVCRGRQTLTVSKLLFAALLPESLQSELARVDEVNFSFVHSNQF